jgi:hypothetical protein
MGGKQMRGASEILGIGVSKGNLSSGGDLRGNRVTLICAEVCIESLSW